MQLENGMHQDIYTKDDLIKNNNITSAIFLLDQKVEPLEFFDRLKVIALGFNRLTNREKTILKHWIRNTVDANIAENAVKILESDMEEVETMVANNAFMIKEMKEKAEKEGIKKDKIETVKKLLSKKFGDIGNEYINKINKLNIDKLNLIVENILEVESLEEVEKYL
jgi:hypothetical protein